MRVPLAAALAAVLLLPGCLQNGGSATSTSTLPAATGTATSTPTSGMNGVPVAALVATPGNGTAALNVTFTLSGSDPDGDALSWTLAFGDGTANQTGAALPANATHAYAQAGSYAVGLVVTDGRASATVRAHLNLTLPAAANATTAGQEIALSWMVGFTDRHYASSPMEGLNCEAGPNDGVNVASFTLDPATIGLPFKATITDATGGAGIVSWKILFNLEDCSDFTETFSADGAAAITGVVPADSGPFVFLQSTGGVELEVLYQSGSKVTA